MKAFAHLVPTKEHHCNERGLHEECQNAFDGKRCTEDVAHKPAIITPVRTKLELQNQPRSHTYGKVDSEKFHPELGCVFPKLITRTVIRRFHDAHNNRQSQSQRYKNPMIDSSQGELRSRPVNQGSVNVFKHES